MVLIGLYFKPRACRQVHQEVCALLLSALDSLRNTMEDYANLMPQWKRRIEATPAVLRIDSAQRLRKMADLAKVIIIKSYFKIQKILVLF